jgi:hypothetical protein
MEIIETVLLSLNTFAPGMSFEEAGFRLLLADIAGRHMYYRGSRAFGTERRLSQATALAGKGELWTISQR